MSEVSRTTQGLRLPPVVALVGATGVGKTERSLDLATALGADIVNCDSRQIYRGMDIGTAKPTAEEQARVPHHLFDLVEPDEAFHCARYRELASECVDSLRQAGRAVVLVGGTGLYLKALRYGLFPGPPRDEGLRDALYEQERKAPGCLHSELAGCDPQTAGRVHPNDLVRVVRALEVFQLTGRPISAWQDDHRFAGEQLAMTVIGFSVERDQLYRRLDARCRQMVEAGLVDEVRGLLERGCRRSSQAMQGIGYREIAEHLDGKLSLDEAVDRMARATRRFAKRQGTWFRADPTIKWLDVGAADLAALQALL